MLIKSIVLNQLPIVTQYDELPHPPGVFHFELFLVGRCHYNVIVGLDCYLASTANTPTTSIIYYDIIFFWLFELNNLTPAVNSTIVSSHTGKIK